VLCDIGQVKDSLALTQASKRYLEKAQLVRVSPSSRALCKIKRNACGSSLELATEIGWKFLAPGLPVKIDC